MRIDGVEFWDRPSQRIYQVYNAERVCVGAWTSIGLEHALCALAQSPRGELLVCDEYHGRGRWTGHAIRVVIDTVRPV